MSLPSGPPDPLSNLQVERLFASELLEISNYRCRAGPHSEKRVQRQTLHLVAFPHSGAFELLQEGRRSLIDSNRVLFHNAGLEYMTRHPVGWCDSGSAIAVRGDVLVEMASRHDARVADHPGRPFAVTHVAISSRALLRERLLVRHLTEAGAPNALAAEETALHLVDEVVALAYRAGEAEALPVRHESERRKALVAAAQVLLAARFKEQLSLAEIAVALHASPFHLCRSFRRETGLTIHRYRTRLRLREALHLLWSSGADLTTLALDLGFDTHSHFTAAFRREFGVPPRAVRDVRVTTADLRRIVRELEADAARFPAISSATR